jgi:hypothetical protein
MPVRKYNCEYVVGLLCKNPGIYLAVLFLAIFLTYYKCQPQNWNLISQLTVFLHNIISQWLSDGMLFRVRIAYASFKDFVYHAWPISFAYYMYKLESIVVKQSKAKPKYMPYLPEYNEHISFTYFEMYDSILYMHIFSIW